MVDSPVEVESEGLKGISKGTKILVGIIIAIVLVALIAVFTLTIGVMETQFSASAPKSVPGSDRPVGASPPIQ